MEPEGSLPHSQVPATCPCPDPAQPSPYPTSHFLKTHLNIIFPSAPGSPQCYLSLKFPHQNPAHASALPHTCHMPHLSHSSRFYHSHNIGHSLTLLQKKKRVAVIISSKQQGPHDFVCTHHTSHSKLRVMQRSLIKKHEDFQTTSICVMHVNAPVVTCFSQERNKF
jgi:hypothetical protein